MHDTALQQQGQEDGTASTRAACVVIPFRNFGDCARLAMLERLLDSLQKQTCRSALTIVLSLDGGDPVPHDIREAADVVVDGTAAGPATARNRGWKSCEAPYVLFTDSDCIPEPDWAAVLLHALVQAGADGAKGVYSSGGASMIQRLTQIEFEERYMLLAKRPSEIDMVDTYAACFSREALRRVEGFDESFPAADHEDVDLSYRMRQLGMRLIFVPEARVAHTHRGTWRAYFKLKMSRGFWRVKILSAHPGRTLSDRYAPRSMKLQMALCGLFPFAWVAAISVSAAIPLAWLLLFLMTCMTLFRIALTKDAGTATLIPFFAFWRGTALVTGVIRGLVHRPRPR